MFLIQIDQCSNNGACVLDLLNSNHKKTLLYLKYLHLWYGTVTKKFGTVLRCLYTFGLIWVNKTNVTTHYV